MRCSLLAIFLVLLSGSALAKRKQRVINGTEARLGEFPSIVSIWIKANRYDKHNCGGTLVDDDTILTAAHCFDQIPAKYIKVKINIHNLNETSAIKVGVSQVRI